MSIKQIIKTCVFIVLLSSCAKKTDNEKLAKYYHDVSNMYLQPSELYRTYKDSAIQTYPEKVIYTQKLSYSYKKVGDHIKAMEVLNKAVAIDTANGKADVLQYKAWTLLYYYRDYKGTIKDIELIEKITGNTYNTCWGEPCGFIKGQALYKLGNYKNAIKAFETVNNEEQKLGFDINDNYMNFFYIGRCYAEQKDYNNAIKYYKKALASVDRFPEAYYNLGLVYKALNNTIKANENFILAKQTLDFSINEPYIERFDEVFMYMIDREL